MPLGPTIDEETTWSVTFAPEELYLLAGLLQLPALIGMDDPFFGVLADEIEARLARARQSLADREHLEIGEEGEVTLDGTIAAIVDAIGTARRTLVVSHTDVSGASPLRYVHLTPDLLVEQETRSGGEIALTAVRDGQALWQRIEELVALPEAPAAPGGDITLPESDLADARRLAKSEGVDACREVLRRVGVPSTILDCLASALDGRGSAGSLILLDRQESEIRHAESLAWVAGVDGAWLVQPREVDGRPAVRLIPAAAAAIRQRARGMVELSAT